MGYMKIGTLDFKPIDENYGLVAAPIKEKLWGTDLAAGVFVASIDAKLSDTAAFCEHYGVGLDISANCLIIQAKRADRTWYVACIVPATGRADVNGIVKKTLEARKISFAPMDTALALSGMEFGGITPIGLPDDWQILIDASLMKHDVVIIGGGVRGSKIAIKTKTLQALPGVTVLSLIKSEI